MPFSFAFPRDLPACAAGFAQALRWRFALLVSPPEALAERIRKHAARRELLRGGLDKLEKRQRAADVLLRKVLHSKAHSATTALAVYDLALRMGLYATLTIKQPESGMPANASVQLCGAPFPQEDSLFTFHPPVL